MAKQLLNLAVGSTNPVKINSVRLGIQSCFMTDSCEIETFGFEVESGVAAQPKGEQETKLGAMNRAKLSFDAYRVKYNSNPTYSVGLEGGVAITKEHLNHDNGVMECFAYVVIYDGNKFGYSKTATFCLPKRIRDLVLSGKELGDADDMVFGSTNSKQKGGTVGHLTNGIIDRTKYYQHAVVLAMIPFQPAVMYLYEDQCNLRL